MIKNEFLILYKSLFKENCLIFHYLKMIKNKEKKKKQKNN